MNVRFAVALVLLLAGHGALAAEPRTLDAFDDIGQWSAVASDSVSASLRSVEGVHGKAMCLDYDFNGVSGYAVARRVLPMRYPANYEFALQLRGSGPVNNLEFKLADASGDNVWWVDKPNFALPATWMPMKLKKRHIAFAWGPTQDKVLRTSQSFEMTISAGRGGGKGEACIDELAFRELPADDQPPPAPIAHASNQMPANPATGAVDGDPATAWRASLQGTPELIVDLGREREFGGFVLHWLAKEHASRYRIALSDDAQHWHDVRTVVDGGGGNDPIALPESEGRYVRLRLEGGPGKTYGLSAIDIEPLAFAATPNDFLKAVASDAPRGWFPRGFVGEQSYWTIVGVDGGADQGLIGEDGDVEFTKGGASVTPMVISDGKLVTWADVQTSQTLQDGYLPIPSVQWRHHDFGLRVTAFAQGDARRAQMFVRYRIDNTTTATHAYTLALAVQPWQVNPPSQFLNTAGGSVHVGSLALTKDGQAMVGASATDMRTAFRALQAPDGLIATSFDQGMVASRLSSGELTGGAKDARAQIADETGLASGALLYRMTLRPGESREVVLAQPLSNGQAADAHGSVHETIDVDAAQRAVAAQWHATLDRVKLRVPWQGQHFVDTLHTALAHMLISRTGPRLQPGTRSYARAWIRDGAMIGEALSRLGKVDVAEDFVRWYAPYQFANGKVPCCVDDRGADPVPENDSQGEFVHAVAQVYRYTQDHAFLELMWPHVAAATAYMDTLRASERTEANRARDPAFFGLMPASISHEGYSAKPMHSYWDDFWALRGYKDAVAIAQWLDKPDVTRFAASRDEFRGDLYASLAAATRERQIDFIPGSAELGDFDATSTTISLSPGGEQAFLPTDLLRNTFERYWKEFVERRDGLREWTAYTPYELRTIGSFVRLGWRDRADEALSFFFAGQQPRGWNQWAEVVSHTPRKPFFVGDLPHAWVESDYVRSALDLFAYDRESDDALVIAAGIPLDWMQGDGVAVEGLRTPYGSLGYALRQTRGHLRLHVAAGAAPPGGFVVPWPYTGQPGDTRINGKLADWRDGELRVKQAPFDVDIAVPAH